ncbi:FAD-binding oxidoreductase [Aggregatilinea lenta]|uniref:FAD-binding oxidoreductase n=1 Tax=Aggregatilinea lenta TaxID=913108 RepID=UPI000E5A9016|nr:FAD-binding oxidoreductase [Aggregatilinea lenta]
MANKACARDHRSWGRYPKIRQQKVVPVYWRDDQIDLSAIDGTILPYGLGRSYGDSCQNEGGTLIDIAPLNRMIAFDEDAGLLRCEAGVSLADILKVIVPRGWFLPTTPGTKFVTIGGAIANDVHGKNHHVAGTFGRHVTQFELLRSNGERLICSPEQNAEMYRATIGGLGLTGLILWAEFKLRRVPGPFIASEQIRFRNVDEFFDISAESEHRFEYTVAWVDCLAAGKQLGRGLFMRGNHAWPNKVPGKKAGQRSLFTVPVDLPWFALNMVTARVFNTALYHSQLGKSKRKVVPYDSFFYPLDMIHEWNRLYGSPGFIQYQFVIPFDHDRSAIKSIFKQISDSGVLSLLSVLKVFGDVPSPGMLSFPRPGVTLALDFPVRGQHTLDLLDRLDRVVQDEGGAIYPAKDSRMSAQGFQSFYPQWQDFSQYVDPKFSSSFWRRVTRTTE